MSPASHTRCGVHPETPAVDVCTRCGTFVCFTCVDGLAGNVYCAPCVRKLTAPPPRERAPARTYVALGLAVVGFVLVPLAVVAIGMGLLERWRIRRGRAPVAGERNARAATTVGVIALLCFPVILPMLIVLFF